MSKVRIIGPKFLLMDVVSHIHDMGVVHIDDFVNEVKDPDIVSRMGYSIVSGMQYNKVFDQERKDLQDEFVKAKAILDSLPSVQIDQKRFKKMMSEFCELTEAELLKMSRDISLTEQAKIEPLLDKRRYIQNRLASFPKYKHILEKIQPLVSRLTTFQSFSTLALIIQKEFEGVIDLLKAEIAKITHNQFELLSAEVDDETIAAILLVRDKYFEEVNELIYEKNVNELKLPEHLRDLPLTEVFETLDREERELPVELKRIDDQLRDIAKSDSAELAAIVNSLADRKSEIDHLPQFAETETSFLIIGWVPDESLPKLKQSLNDEFGSRILFHSCAPAREEYGRVPIKLKNLPGAKSFEWFLSIVSYPKYGTIDPTIFMAFFFPIFFGMILGDIGYGLILLALGIYFRKTSKNAFLINFSPILIISSISAIFFGVLYGEFFGELGEHFGLHPLVINRFENIGAMIIFSIALGASHVILGLILGVINGFKMRHYSHVVEKLTMIAMLFCLFSLIAVSADIVPHVIFTPALVILLIGVPILIYTAGVVGAIEVISTIGNILSYARIAAIGISSVILAMVANKLGGAVSSLAVGIIIASLLHILNIALGAFSPTIHSIRLHYVEFFTKFYENGVVKYKPFLRTGR